MLGCPCSGRLASCEKSEVDVRQIWACTPPHVTYTTLGALLMFLTIRFLFWNVNITLSPKVISVDAKHFPNNVAYIIRYSVSVNLSSVSFFSLNRLYQVILKNLLGISAFVNYSVQSRMRPVISPLSRYCSDQRQKQEARPEQSTARGGGGREWIVRSSPQHLWL